MALGKNALLLPYGTKNEGTPKTVACFALIASPHEQAGAVNTSFRRRRHVLDITRMLPALSRI